MNNISDQELDRALREVIKRALVDSDFRAKALSNGTAAVKSISNKSLPEGYTFTFVENKGKNRTVVLPAMVSDKDQIREEDLEQVAGGIAGVVSPCDGTCGSGSCITT